MIQFLILRVSILLHHRKGVQKWIIILLAHLMEGVCRRERIVVL